MSPLVAPPRLSALSGFQLIDALREGGYVLVMRHPSSPTVRPDCRDAHSGNDRLERQLDAPGSRLVRAMGISMKRLAIKVSPVYSSPAFRAREALHIAGFEEIVTTPELDENSCFDQRRSGMHTRWLQAQSARTPSPGNNTLLMTHLPNLVDAFEGVGSVAVGEVLVYMPAQTEIGTLIARVRIEEWPQLAMLAGIGYLSQPD